MSIKAFLIKNKRGSAIVAAYMAIAVLTTLGTALVSRGIQENKYVDTQRKVSKALYLAEAGVERTKRELYEAFLAYYTAMGQIPAAFTWFDMLIEYPASTYEAPQNESFGGGTYSVQIVDVRNPDYPQQLGRRDVVIRSTGTVEGMSKTVEVVIRFALGPSHVFDYAYFINNFGWFWGRPIEANGDVRANGDFSLRNSPIVNGDIYASRNPALGAVGYIMGDWGYETIRHYRDNSPDRARPTNPTADPEDENGNGVLDEGEDRNNNGQLDDFSYSAGYDGTSEAHPYQDVLNMPYLGDLDIYRSLAIEEGGYIKQGDTTIVDAVYNGPGPDGHYGTPDDGCLVLVGTEDNPIEIHGPVVVNGDVVIKGYVKGQGTIYAGRNIHIVGDLKYTDPPVWEKPDENPQETAEANATKDFLGLMSKGNIILGDYTSTDWQQHVFRYLRPPFTQRYETDPTDAVNGYDSDWNPANGYYFEGDYIAYDGGQKIDMDGRAVPRKYYETSISESLFRSLASNNIHQVDAVLYTNHLIGGRVAEIEINGCVVARDEAIVYTHRIYLNYDVRARKGVEFIDIYLARDLADPEIVSWREVE